MDLTPLIISFELAIVVSVVLLLVCLPLAYMISFSKSKFVLVVESILMLPIVLPPTVMGFYFLIALGPESAIGKWLNNWFGIDLAFSFIGIAVASIFYCLPFMLNPLVVGFRSLPRNLTDLIRISGKSKMNALTRVFIPTLKINILGAFVITFAHVMGQFGLILMVGGKMSNTKVASVAIYDEMNLLNMNSANNYAVALLVISFFFIALVTWLSRKQHAKF